MLSLEGISRNFCGHRHVGLLHLLAMCSFSASNGWRERIFNFNEFMFTFERAIFVAAVLDPTANRHILCLLAGLSVPCTTWGASDQEAFPCLPSGMSGSLGL